RTRRWLHPAVIDLAAWYQRDLVIARALSLCLRHSLRYCVRNRAAEDSLNTIFYNRRDIFSMARLKHHVPQIKEILPLMKFKMPTLDRRAARLAAVGNVWDIRKIAKRRTPTPAFDYVDGAAQSEITISRSRKYFNDIELIPKILHSTPDVDLSTTIAGGKSSLPFGIAPTGFTRFMHSEGEDAGAASASKAGIPFSLSTMGTRSIEE